MIMPKGKKSKRKGGGPGGRSGDSRPTLPSSEEDYDTADNLSVISNYSETKSVLDEVSETGDTEVVDETGAQELYEEKIKEYVEETTDKSSKLREHGLKGLIDALSKKYCCDFLEDRYVTIADSLERCLKKGKGEEQGLAANCVSLMIIQLGPDSTGEEFYNTLQPVLQTVVLDKSANTKARAKVAETLGLMTFISGGDLEHVLAIMDVMETIFKASFYKGDGTPPVITPDQAILHCSALSAWSLLLTIASNTIITRLVTSHLSKLPMLMESSDVDLRIVAGETIALLYELSREIKEDFEGNDEDVLCARLKQLATDSNKFRAKKDRRQQRSSFRDILRAVEEGEAPEVTVKFGFEVLYIDSWISKRQYDAICHAVGSGMNHHLQENMLLREIFQLGNPICAATAKLQKSSRTDRHNFNAAAFKARTKARAKVRDKRFVHAAF